MTDVYSTPQHVLLQFNKATGAYIMCLSYVDPSTLDNTYYVYAEVKSFVPGAQTVTGLYPDHTIVNNVDLKPVVYETDLNNKCRQRILREYSHEAQLDNIRVVVEHIASFLETKYKTLTVDGLEDLKEMSAVINELKDANSKLKESYKANTEINYISAGDEMAIRDAQLEGGLHNLIRGTQL